MGSQTTLQFTNNFSVCPHESATLGFGRARQRQLVHMRDPKHLRQLLFPIDRGINEHELPAEKLRDPRERHRGRRRLGQALRREAKRMVYSPGRSQD